MGSDPPRMVFMSQMLRPILRVDDRATVLTLRIHNEVDL